MSSLRALVCLTALMLLGTVFTAPAAAEAGWPPVNPLLERHSNFFEPARIYDIQTDAYSKSQMPAGLSYKAYVAVGYDLANTILILGPANEIVVVDTLGDEDTVHEVLAEFRKQGYLPQGKLPTKAIRYTHNHIDHTAGVRAFLA